LRKFIDSGTVFLFFLFIADTLSVENLIKERIRMKDLVKIEIGTPDKAGAKNLETVCIAEECSIDWNLFEQIAKLSGKVLVTSYVEAS
jgi:hypothetical protein